VIHEQNALAANGLLVDLEGTKQCRVRSLTSNTFFSSGVSFALTMAARSTGTDSNLPTAFAISTTG
jgi:hypothetical protein